MAHNQAFTGVRRLNLTQPIGVVSKRLRPLGLGFEHRQDFSKLNNILINDLKNALEIILLIIFRLYCFKIKICMCICTHIYTRMYRLALKYRFRKRDTERDRDSQKDFESSFEFLTSSINRTKPIYILKLNNPFVF